MMRIIVRENRRAMDYLRRPWSKFGNPELPEVLGICGSVSPTCVEGGAAPGPPILLTIAFVLNCG